MKSEQNKEEKEIRGQQGKIEQIFLEKINSLHNLIENDKSQSQRIKQEESLKELRNTVQQKFELLSQMQLDQNQKFDNDILLLKNDIKNIKHKVNERF